MMPAVSDVFSTLAGGCAGPFSLRWWHGSPRAARSAPVHRLRPPVHAVQRGRLGRLRTAGMSLRRASMGSGR